MHDAFSKLDRARRAIRLAMLVENVGDVAFKINWCWCGFMLVCAIAQRTYPTWISILCSLNAIVAMVTGFASLPLLKRANRIAKEALDASYKET